MEKMMTEYEKAARDTYEKVPIHELINFDKKPENPVKVSIVIPVCNVETYLRECLDSAVNQTLKDIEIICVNDGSTDGSLAILKEYAQADTRVKIIDKDNAGYGHAMNIGMDMASGEYIGIIESDDYILPEMYDKLYDIAQKEHLDFIKSDFFRFYGEGEGIKKVYNKIAKDEKNYNKIICPSDLQETFKFIMNTWSGIYSTSFLRNYCIRHNETPGASFQDNGFWFKTNVYAQRTWYLNEAFYMNRRDNPNSSVYNPEKVYCANQEYMLIYNYLEEHGLKDKFLSVYNYKKYHSYIFTLRRIAPEFRKEYLKTISNEFKEIRRKNELKSEYLSNTDWDNLYWIMRDYEEFYYNSFCREVKVSVILPVYNVENFLEKTLSSLLEQTLKEIEIICVDDCSTDNSLAILKTYQNKDNRIKIIENKENKGAGAARNKGMEIAQGQYLSFLDADDYFDKDMLKLAYNRAEEKKADICIYEANLVDNRTGEIKKCSFSVKEDQLPKDEVFSRYKIKNNIFKCIMGWAWDKLYKRSFVLNQGLHFQEQRTTNDMYFVYASLLKAGRITILKKPLYYQRRNVSTSLSNTRELSWECFYHALIKVKNELENMGIYAEYRQDFVNYALHSCLWNFNSFNEPTAKMLFDRLRTEWFDNLDITGNDSTYFSDKKEYQQYLYIIEIPMTDNMAYYSYQINNWKRKCEDGLKDSILSVPVKISEKEILTVAQMKEKLGWNRKKREELERKEKNLNNKLNVEEEEIKRLENEIQNLQQCKYELEETRKSRTYKLAMFLTWIPRKIRGV